MLADKHRIEKEQNTQLRNQVSHLLEWEQDQKLQIEERDSTIQNLQVDGLVPFKFPLSLKAVAFHLEFAFNLHGLWPTRMLCFLPSSL